jgi:hypothetical protein
VLCGVVWCCVVLCGVELCGVVWCGVVLCGVVQTLGDKLCCTKRESESAELSELWGLR